MHRNLFRFALLCVALALVPSLRSMPASADATSEEAAQLKTTLTPMGAERGPSADGLIPAWTGGFTGTLPNTTRGGRITDPFPNDKPILTITAQNMDQYADRLTDGTKAMLKKYPDFKLVVYPTRRTAMAPQSVYDATYQNAMNGTLHGYVPANVHGGVPFPIPKNGIEAMLNHSTYWRGPSWSVDQRAYEIDSTGHRSLASEFTGPQQMPYYLPASSSSANGDYWLIRIAAFAPPIRAGTALVVHWNLDPDKNQAWVYLTGQRRVRKVPDGCCDTPADITAGVMTYDEVYTFFGQLDRYDWKLLGKKEMYIPYNDNRATDAPSVSDLLQVHFPNPDLVRWELHRVWVVDATLRAGQRHTSPHARFYLDEDTWVAVLGDRWDAHGNLWKFSWQLMDVVPDIPATIPQAFGINDLQSGTWFANGIINEASHPWVVQSRPYSANEFSPDSLAGESVR